MGQRIDDELLLVDLRRVAEVVDRPPTTTQYEDHGQFSLDPFKRRWGTWDRALVAADLLKESAVTDGQRLTDAELLADLREWAADRDPPYLGADMDREGPHSLTTYERRFGGWPAALREAGLVEIHAVED